MIILYYSLRLSNKSLVNEISERAAYFPKNNKALCAFLGKHAWQRGYFSDEIRYLSEEN